MRERERVGERERGRERERGGEREREREGGREGGKEEDSSNVSRINAFIITFSPVSLCFPSLTFAKPPAETKNIHQ